MIYHPVDVRIGGGGGVCTQARISVSTSLSSHWIPLPPGSATIEQSSKKLTLIEERLLVTKKDTVTNSGEMHRYCMCIKIN